MAEKQTDIKNKEKLNLVITTPRGVKFDLEADMVIMRCIDGDLGVLPGHEALSTVLGDGTLRVINDGIESKIALFGGVVEIDDTKVNIYSTIAQRPEEIDLERAKQDREKAEAALNEKIDDAQFKRLQAMMRRSIVRINVNTQLEDSDYFKVGEDDDEE